MPTIDLNADLGESYGRWTLGDDRAMLGLVTSANVACGFHAGDPATLRETCRLAVGTGVTIGAQVGYPDLAGFGRRFLDMAAPDLTAAVLYQVGALDALARAEGARVGYVKPHGALYHATVEHEGQAAAVVDAVLALDPTLPILGLPGSALLRFAAARGLRPVEEYFVDRNYTPEGRLVDRRRSDALITDPTEAAERAAAAAAGHRVQSLCVHGDSPGAVAMARRIREVFDAEGIVLAAFAPAAGTGTPA
jgi:5-oxoprolinase (ATP-hydrolysing) subunit A